MNKFDIKQDYLNKKYDINGNLVSLEKKNPVRAPETV